MARNVIGPKGQVPDVVFLSADVDTLNGPEASFIDVCFSQPESMGLLTVAMVVKTEKHYCLNYENNCVCSTIDGTLHQPSIPKTQEILQKN